ncbi:MAG TPA: glycosyltransferase family 39 protein [Flavobacteriales bacterium]|nr:glycosyltransferase family 39 protein [Flavobacteriales bacterium]
MSRASYYLSLAGLALVAAVGSVLDVMEIDAAQYAAMARDMLAQDDWRRLYHSGLDYLDKPPLLFWLSALSFKLFGVANWSYKLPSILFAFWGVHATERFARLHHDAATARRAALIFAASAAFLLMTNDVRCDAMLTGSVITAIWAGTAFVEQRRWWQVLLFAVAIAAGLLAKGPMGAMAPALAISGHIVLARRWDALRDARWLLVPVVVAMALWPMCVGLYEQHGAHGLRFFFWEQSFGRITGENRWKDDSSLFFFLHELPWQLLPWTVPLLAGLVIGLRALIHRAPLPEYASISGAMLVFIALSLSRFKLPHYLYVALPLFAVLAARAWPLLQQGWARWVHAFIQLLLVAAAIILVGWCFPIPWWPAPAAALLAVLAAIMIACDRVELVFRRTVLLWVLVGLVVNGLLYPQLLVYQGNAQAGRWLAAEGIARQQVYGIDAGGNALNFYAGYPVHWVPDVASALPLIAPGMVFIVDDARCRELLAARPKIKEAYRFEDYQVQLLSLDFVIPGARAAALTGRWVVRY